jgi:hypothetical protein
VWRIRGGKLYTCKNCRTQFTVRTGTVMAGSKIPLQKWIYAIHLMTVSRKGVSSVQLAKKLGITQKSSWLMATRIRESCHSTGVLGPICEAAESRGDTHCDRPKVSKKSTVRGGRKGKKGLFGLRSHKNQVAPKGTLDFVDSVPTIPSIKPNHPVLVDRRGSGNQSRFGQDSDFGVNQGHA